MATAVIRNKSVGEKLREMRRGRKLSIAALASIIGCDKALISRFENGVGALGRDTAKQIAAYFDGELTRDELIYPELYAKKLTKKPFPGAELQKAS
jgi:transcriptional regulator with XRE-family HTH domain